MAFILAWSPEHLKREGRELDPPVMFPHQLIGCTIDMIGADGAVLGRYDLLGFEQDGKSAVLCPNLIEDGSPPDLILREDVPGDPPVKVGFV